MDWFVAGMRDHGGDFGLVRSPQSAQLSHETTSWLMQATDASRDRLMIEHWQVLGISEVEIAVNRFVSTGVGTRGDRHAVAGYVLSYDELRDLGVDNTILLRKLAALEITFENQREVCLPNVTIDRGQQLPFEPRRLAHAKGLVAAQGDLREDYLPQFETSAENPVQQIQALLDALFLTLVRLPSRMIIRSAPREGEQARGVPMMALSVPQPVTPTTRGGALAEILTRSELLPTLLCERPDLRLAVECVSWLGEVIVLWTIQPGATYPLNVPWLLDLIKSVAGVDGLRSVICLAVEQAISSYGRDKGEALLQLLSDLKETGVAPQYFVKRVAAENNLVLTAIPSTQRLWAAALWNWREFASQLVTCGAVRHLAVRSGILEASTVSTPTDTVDGLLVFKVDQPRTVRVADWLSAARAVLEAANDQAHVASAYDTVGRWLVACSNESSVRLQFTKFLLGLDASELRVFIRSWITRFVDKATDGDTGEKNRIVVLKILCALCGCSAADRNEKSQRFVLLQRLHVHCVNELAEITRGTGSTGAMHLLRKRLLSP